MPISLVAADDPKGIQEPAVLIVEGRDDQRFFKAAALSHGLENLSIVQFLDSQLSPTLRAVVNAPGFGDVIHLGIARDADTNARAAFESACDTLTIVGLTAPASPLVAAGAKPSSSVMIVPDATTSGELADLCLRSLSNDPRLTDCVTAYMACLLKYGSTPPGNREAKAKLYAYLAGLPRPGLPFGVAAEAGFFPWDSAAFNDVRAFLDTLRVT
jgi:hypothetical protein